MSGCSQGQAGSMFCDSCIMYEHCHENSLHNKNLKTSYYVPDKELSIELDKENLKIKENIKEFFYDCINNLNM